jgi:cytochrome c biogenesis protein ResB
VLEPGKPAEEARIEVNKPLRRAGWTLYITNYELAADGMADQCLIEAVRDPWLPGVYAGLMMLLGGAAAMLFRSPFDLRT